MLLRVFDTKEEMGCAAAADGAEAIRAAIAQRGHANIILATGASQFEMLGALVKEEVDWSVVTCFHLDEYVSMPMTHPASFRKYLKERFVDRLPVGPAAFHYIDGQADCQAECRRLDKLIAGSPIDVAFIGIGENGHLAFNDPPADFEAREPYLVVDLDTACRRQQLGEGWFPTLDHVPRQAISMSIPQILRSRKIVCTVPDQRKARAVQRAVEGPVTPEVPASALQRHAATTLFLDIRAAGLLSQRK
jgi:glucosamine-6-phosphate deaminase